MRGLQWKMSPDNESAPETMICLPESGESVYYSKHKIAAGVGNEKLRSYDLLSLASVIFSRSLLISTGFSMKSMAPSFMTSTVA